MTHFNEGGYKLESVSFAVNCLSAKCNQSAELPCQLYVFVSRRGDFHVSSSSSHEFE